MPQNDSLPTGHVAHGKSITSPQIVTTAERRRFEIDLREKRYSYRVIAASTIQRFGIENLPKGYDERYAAKDVMAELRAWRREMREDLDSIVELELRQLDDLERAHFDAALRGNVRSTEVILRIKEQRAKLLGLNAPVKVKVDYRAELVQRIHMGELTIAQLRQELGDDYVDELLKGTVLVGDDSPKELGEGEIIDGEFNAVEDSAKELAPTT